MTDSSPAAYGGAGWSPRLTALHEELGSVWSECGVDSEWLPLRSVLLHRPGAELDVADADAALMLARPDIARAAAQHDGLAGAYVAAGVAVHYVEPVYAQPNQVFCADLFVMTPSGAIVGRPASTVRAGEERWVARRLADLGVPILRSVGGHGTFEGADLMWLDERSALVGTGLRTNDDGARQVAAALAELDVRCIATTVSRGAMHLMGELRIVDRDLALVHRVGVADSAVAALQQHGFDVHDFRHEEELHDGFAHNFVVLGPRRILMPEGNPKSERYYVSLGIECVAIAVDELAKAAGGIACMTGVLRRDRPGAVP
jgi:arginine deiminase